MNIISEGQPVPHFTALDQNGETVDSSNFKGNKTLVYFYPKAMTPGCTVQAQGLRDSKAELDAKGVKVYGISIDPVKRLGKFIERDELNFDLLSDEEHSVADKFGVWGPKKFMGREFDGLHRISFLINEDGVIEKVFNKFKTKDHHQVVLDYLNA
ncbi:thioredoxin-dependent thiol peroxidase [Planctobacterium marinum]|uniref:thioredoxin-dependent peroxiredoxin n=1 Tax=Planctobacterium marinum TaxID=1631968 RepID=A0AA48HRJ2_9ALTE|nr:peroxiredoxin [Planctobacterium marinum]